MDEGVKNPNIVDNNFFSPAKRPYILSVILLGATIIWLLTCLVVFVIKDYGWALFFGGPLFASSLASYLATVKHRVSGAEAIYISFATLLLASVGIIVFAIEGFICLAMAAPFEIIVAIFAGFVGRQFGLLTLQKRGIGNKLLFAPVFLFAGAFVDFKPDTYTAVTSVVIDAPPAIVWKNVVEFSEIPPPTEFIFKTGIAYPINAKIVGTGVGAIRHCNFTTGSFVEPITVWDEPRLLAFDVLEQPEPMVEISPYDIEPAHLHGYFVSEKGQFKLTDLGNGKTLLEGTTWYHHKISPAFYWHLWSNNILHAIHNRVLNCVKVESEKQAKGE